MSFLRAIEDEGIYHVQFNIISSEELKKRDERTGKIPRLNGASCQFYRLFVELTPEQQQEHHQPHRTPGLFSQ